jgi:hypothetical protein
VWGSVDGLVSVGVGVDSVTVVEVGGAVVVVGGAVVVVGGGVVGVPESVGVGVDVVHGATPPLYQD